ncbi:uncharacterized protein LOC131994002 isoform X2 [Stomoxys calcitrans]|uniref:MADF domain-containing protein n=1 Tax=Stomoxys calcitrans TaxID=35570 RepID=A0A1I8NRW7_STOCA|nr:uncharacterized protein LOC106085455 isoform X2 [Stomoxys calcitrans]XP_059224234.1 uncharacterized protein LOC131994002 isoform X2 [Stomoxys calcitrans]
MDKVSSFIFLWIIINLLIQLFDLLQLIWPKEAILEMIAMWKNNECLYNPRNRFYHKKKCRNDVLTEIAERMKAYNIKVGPNQNKLQYLRGQFTRELAKARESQNAVNPDDVYVPCTYWFKELDFLLDYVKVRKEKSNFNSLQQHYSQFEEDTYESSQAHESDVSAEEPIKKVKRRHHTPVASCSMKNEEVVVEPEVNVLPHVFSVNKTSSNEKDEAFCNFIKSELQTITNENVRDELVETITLALFEAKKKQRMYAHAAEQYY